MLSKRSIAYILIFGLLTIVACSFEDVFPMPEPTPIPTEDHTVNVHHDCYRDGYQTYVAMKGNYCFAYPSGYFVTRESNAENMTLQYFDPTPTPEEIANSNDIFPQALQISISILYNSLPEDITLEDFAKADEEEYKYTGELLEWSIDNEDALLRTEAIEPPDEENKEPNDAELVKPKKVSYILYAKHDKTYYKITFQSPSAISKQDDSAKELEYIFFLILDTFTFIDR